MWMEMASKLKEFSHCCNLSGNRKAGGFGFMSDSSLFLSDDNHASSCACKKEEGDCKVLEAPQKGKKRTASPLGRGKRSIRAELVNVLCLEGVGQLEDAFDLGQKLGSGKYGVVRECWRRADGKRFACKSIVKSALYRQSNLNMLRVEVEVLRKLEGCPNIVRMEAVHEDESHVHIVMQICEGPTLTDHILQQGHYSERVAAGLMRSIITVIGYCHSHNIIHRDIKPSNFVFLHDPLKSPLMAIDFGLASFFEPGEEKSHIAGSPLYLAPEVLQKKYGPKCDVWSAGVVLYLLLTGRAPFKEDSVQTTYHAIRTKPLDLSSHPWPLISPEAKDLVGLMLDRDWEKRPSAEDLLQHEWLLPSANGVEEGSAMISPLVDLHNEIVPQLRRFASAANLRQATTQVLGEVTNSVDLSDLRTECEKEDEVCSGLVTMEALKKSLRKMGSSGIAAQLSLEMKKTDEDHAHTMIEYRPLVKEAEKSFREGREQRLALACKEMDSEKSGLLSLDDLRHVCFSHGFCNKARIQRAFSESQKNTDDRVEYVEFLSHLMEATAGDAISEYDEDPNKISAGQEEAQVMLTSSLAYL